MITVYNLIFGLESLCNDKFGAINSNIYQDTEIFWQQGRLSNCVDDTFQANAKNGLTKEQALAIIEAADKYATTLLSPPLYPLYGIRRKINKEFGFVYKIDMEK